MNKFERSMKAGEGASCFREAIDGASAREMELVGGILTGLLNNLVARLGQLAHEGEQHAMD